MENKHLTVRLRPFEGESLSSYLRRISKANGISFLSFWNYLKTEQNHYAQYDEITLLDFCPLNIINIEKLSNTIRREPNELLSLTLYNLLQLFAVGTEIERSRFTSGMLRETLYFCPACLKNKPYHRLLWRIKGIDACMTHCRLLQDKCPHCAKGIKYRDVYVHDKCPYCDLDLSRVLDSPSERDIDWDQQSWWWYSWNQLLNYSDLKISPQNVALRMLYLINNRQVIFDKKRAISDIQRACKLPTLLQHARDSLKQKRTLHISYILEVLWEKHLDIDDFLNMELPQPFIDSVLNPTRLKKEMLSCQAPWCENLGVDGGLIQTGTTFKRKKSGQVLSYYLSCLDCGCEYAINDQGELQERTYFISAYHLIKNSLCEGEHITSIIEKSGLSLDKLKRCIAYFYTRGIKFCAYETDSIQIETQVLGPFIAAIKKNVPLKSIRKWGCWTNYVHFLVYRFHKIVMKELLMQTRKRPKRNNAEQNLNKVKRVVEEMYHQETTITIGAVAEQIGVSVNTIRNWGCCPYIKKMKKSQIEERVFMEKERIYGFVEEYLMERSQTRVFSSQLYKDLQKRRNLLWRIAPELTVFVEERVRIHNKKVKELVSRTTSP
ncbi:TniQ family protein [Brevibacillus sp. 7WMA2]|uniref:TniQ family protein n=1 Tax=Brevibacillus sp. 7WMA2 TaxID=2683193 RepID=UPI0013A7459D|nr:TniQ family protein [Brevibacillus sp. 7WMA2]QIC07173.1 TniQ family protein [Brevibacillus sp. 7WMA2]